MHFPRTILCGAAAAVSLAALLAGCVEQTMTIDSNPPGALVYLNNQEVGRTPMTRDFKWYGDYDVQLRLEGYETLKTHQKVTAPWWNWVPFDLFASVLPVHAKDHRQLQYTLRPLDPAKAQPEGLLERAGQLRVKLESSEYTKKPATRPATTRSIQPSTTRSSQPAK